MIKSRLLALSFIVVIGWGCSSGTDQNSTQLEAAFTGELPIDSSATTSEIDLTIIDEDTAENQTDTLFHQQTDEGQLNGTIPFDERGQYPLIFSWQGQEIGQSRVILASEDTIRIEGDLSDLEENFSITSRELEAMDVYQRLNRGFQHVARVISAGGLSGDSLHQEVNKWSDLFWEQYEDKSGTIGSELSARESVQMLEGISNDKMMKRIRSLHHQDQFIDLGLNYGQAYTAERQGLDSTLDYLDSLATFTDNDSIQKQIGMQRVKILYDSARVDDAQKALTAFQEQYPEESEQWVEAISYDLNYLSPGEELPEFQFAENGETVSLESMKGTPYILEITQLSDPLYQNQFDRTVVIHSLYKNFGLDVITIPLDESQITIDAFFEERVKPWSVAGAEAFDREELLRDFNVQRLPTRFLVDTDGKIVRKYVGQEYDEIIQGIQTLLNQDKSTS